MSIVDTSTNQRRSICKLKSFHSSTTASSADFDHWRCTQPAGDVDVLWRHHRRPHLSRVLSCTGVAQGLGGKERDAAGGECRIGWSTEGANNSWDGDEEENGGGRESSSYIFMPRSTRNTHPGGGRNQPPLRLPRWLVRDRYADLVRTFTGAVIYSPGNANQFGC